MTISQVFRAGSGKNQKKSSNLDICTNLVIFAFFAQHPHVNDASFLTHQFIF